MDHANKTIKSKVQTKVKVNKFQLGEAAVNRIWEDEKALRDCLDTDKIPHGEHKQHTCSLTPI